MYGLIVLAALGGWAIWRQQSSDDITIDVPKRLSDKLDKLWDIAQDSLANKKYLRAEKALLTILRVDERNATAYNRLGILYAKQRAYKDAIECFEIAQSLEPSASSLHNVGLIHYEIEEYPKAALAFEQALKIDSDHAARHIAYAKVQEKLNNTDAVITSLEQAVKIEPSVQSYRLLAGAYKRAGRHDDATALQARIERAVARHNTPKRVTQKRRVVM